MATLAELREEVRQRADIQAETARYPDSELNGYINRSYKELYGLLARHSLVRDEKVQTITADGSASYAAPTDHFATLAFFYETDEAYIPLHRHTFRDRPMGAAKSIEGYGQAYRVTKLAGTKTLELYPRPSSGTYLHVYVPVPATLVADDDAVDGTMGWEEYIVIDVAIKCLRKEGSSTGELRADKAEIKARIEEEADAQEMAQSLTVASTRRHGDYRRPFDPADYRRHWDSI
jgi:hypothetical protein